MKSKSEGTPDVTKCGTGFRYRRPGDPQVGTEDEAQYLRDRNADLERRCAAYEEQDRALKELLTQSQPLFGATNKAKTNGANGHGNGRGGAV